MADTAKEEGRPQTIEEVLPLLPPRDYWFAKELAAALGVSVSVISKVRRRHPEGLVGKAIGRKGLKQHTYVYTKSDLPYFFGRKSGWKKGRRRVGQKNQKPKPTEDLDPGDRTNAFRND